MKNVLTILMLLLLSFTGRGQTMVTETGACSLDETGNDYWEAVEVALERAKALAVAKTNGEDVSVFALSRSDDNKTSFMTRYHLGSCGAIRVLDETVTRKGNDVVVEIDALVYDAQNQYTVAPTNIKRSYSRSEDIKFDLYFSKPSYLKIFWIDEETKEGGILYNGNLRFVANGKQVSFPFDRADNYKKSICRNLMTPDDCARELSKTGELKPHEPDERGEKFVTLWFVTTNSLENWEGDVTEETFFDWYNQIPVTERNTPINKTISIKMM